MRTPIRSLTDRTPPLARSRSIFRLGLSLVAAACLVALASLPACSEEAPQAPPSAVTEAIAAAPAPQSPEQMIVGAYINDIQEIDFKANNYIVDFYVWFRWRNPELDPAKSLEFMNRYASGDNIREQLYDKPKPMPDGSLYSVIRYQGRFSSKFGLEHYPFDTQSLLILMEDSVSGQRGAGVRARRRPSGAARSLHHAAGLQSRRAEYEHRRQYVFDEFRRRIFA